MREENACHFKGGGVRYTPASVAALKATELQNKVCPPRVLFASNCQLLSSKTEINLSPRSFERHCARRTLAAVSPTCLLPAKCSIFLRRRSRRNTVEFKLQRYRRTSPLQIIIWRPPVHSHLRRAASRNIGHNFTSLLRWAGNNLALAALGGMITKDLRIGEPSHSKCVKSFSRLLLRERW